MKKNLKTTRTMGQLLGMAVSASLLSVAQASVTVGWGPQAEGALFQDTSGGTVDGSGITFALGIFEPGFDPGAQPFSAWSDAWLEIDSGVVNTDPFPPLGGVPRNRLVGASVTFGTALPDSVTVDFDALETNKVLMEQAKLYIWAYDSQDVSLNPLWALVSHDGTSDDWSSNTDTDTDGDNWVVADGASTSHTPSQPVSLGLANETVVGSVNTLASGSLVFETVPEPSSVMLLALSGLGLLRRKR